jgi:predicted transcriptional regulator
MPFTRGNKKFTLRIPEPLASRITDFAEKMNKTPSEVIRQAVKEFFWNIDHKQDEHKGE